jgi:hypothetical protein
MNRRVRRLRRRLSDRTRLWKPRIQSVEGRLRRQRVIHIIHIGKTGGLAIKEAIRGDIRSVRSVYQDVAPGTRIMTHSHHIALRHIPAGDDVVVILRDPVARFASGFNSRLRQGMPKHFNAWSPGEERAFARFATAEALALALSAVEPEARAQAQEAMLVIGHVRTHLSDWLGGPDLIRSRREDFLLIGWVETLAEDFERLRELIHLPHDRRLPEDPKVAHQAPREQPRHLREEAVRNLREWYRQDDELIDAMVAMGLTERPLTVAAQRSRT